MTAPRGIRYYGGGELDGYGHAAIANVRALVNAGLAVQWLPMHWTPQDMRAAAWVTQGPGASPLLQLTGQHGHLLDVPTLIERTLAPVDHDTVIVHSPPEGWRAFEPGKRNIGCTVWETDRAPAHWVPLMRTADRIVVPCEMNRATFRRDGLRMPIDVIPHIRRHVWCSFAPRDIADVREDLGIPEGHRVLYTINTWTPRKAMDVLVRCFAEAFTDSDAVTLLIKTDARGTAGGPLYPHAPARELATQAITLAAATLGRPAPNVVLVDSKLDADGIDMIHAIGDVFVSLAHGEGWGLGAFEAAMLGKPVIMTGWGGHLDFLGADWPGAVPYRLVPVPLWPPHKPSYFPSQRWADVDTQAVVRMLREIVADPAPALAAAQRIRERIYADYAEPVLARRWLEVLA